MTITQAFPDERVARMVAAASRGYLREVDAEIGGGADVNYVGTDGISPLLWVLGSRNLKGLEHLVKRGANPNYTDQRRMESAMSLTAGGNWLEALELLLKYGGDPNLPGPMQDPPLFIAAVQSRKENIDLLLKYGADINRENMGRTAATETLIRGRFDLTVYLLERGLTRDLQKLGAAAEGRIVPKTSSQQRWKDQLIAMLKERGVTFPAAVRRVVPPPARVVEEERRRKAQQGPRGENN